jgi:membrane protein implicated in regulation of membrane protease activity
MFWIWAAAVVIFLILELMTPTLVFACFVVASLAAGIYAWFEPTNYYWQIAVFLIVSLILLPATRSLARRITRESPRKSNVDALVGEVGLVVKPIDPDLGGQVKVGSEVWRARSSRAIAVNEKARVIAVAGAHLEVEPITSQEEEQ